MRCSAALLVLLLATAPALAGQPDPVCRQPTVVDEISRQLREDYAYASVEPRLVIEQPTLDPRVVRCDVCVLSAPYDMIRFGDRPVGRCLARGFEVRTLLNGFVVRAER